MDEGVSKASRRDVLKAGGAVAVGAASFFAGAATAAQSAEAAVDPHATGHVPTTIKMEVGGVQVKRIRSASQARMTVNVVATQTGAGGTVFSRGSDAPVTVSVTRDLDGDPSFRTWFAGKASSTGGAPEAIEQTVVLTLLGRRRLHGRHAHADERVAVVVGDRQLDRPGDQGDPADRDGHDRRGPRHVPVGRDRRLTAAVARARRLAR